MTAPQPPAGWYPDPEGGEGQRWWDGAAWTAPPPPGPPAPTVTAARAGRQKGDLIKGLLALVVLGAVVVGVLAVVLAGSGKHDITGDVTLTDSDQSFDVDAPCAGSGGYSDMQAGAEITVKDENGKVLATGTLEAGSGDGTSCVFDFTLKDVPRADFYAIEATHRGQITFSRKQLEADQWFAGLTLGG